MTASDELAALVARCEQARAALATALSVASEHGVIAKLGLDDTLNILRSAEVAALMASALRFAAERKMAQIRADEFWGRDEVAP